VTDQPTVEDGSRTAELWVRADVPGGANDRQERLSERARDVGAYEDVTTRLVPNRLSLSGLPAESPAGAAIRELAADAKRWAADADVDLDPYLPVADESPLASTDDRRVLTFPSIALVERDDDGIAHVAPHVDSERVVSVESRLEALSSTSEREVVTTEP
jgi:hypothetical protein